MVITSTTSSSPYQTCRRRGDRRWPEPTWRIQPDAKICVLGSCFAQELKLKLIEHKWQVTNDQNLVPLVPGQPAYKTDLAYYHPKSVLYELYKAVGHPGPVGTWQLTEGPYAGYWQDPFRRLVFGESEQKLAETTALLDDYMRRAIMDADVWFITTTLIEAWQDPQHKHWACAGPGYGGGGGQGMLKMLYDRHNLLACMLRIAGIAEKLKKEIIFAVCPIALGKTYQAMDHLSANFMGKSMLRTGISDVMVIEPPHVHYFPAYEFCSLFSWVAEDGRHLVPDAYEGLYNFWSAHAQRD